MSPAIEVDARGLRCPLPVIELARAARTATAGETLTVRCTDPASRFDIPAWARMTGNQVLEIDPPDESETDGDEFVVTVRIGQAPASPGETSS